MQIKEHDKSTPEVAKRHHEDEKLYQGRFKFSSRIPVKRQNRIR